MRRSLEAEPAGGTVRRRGTATTRDRGSVRRVILLAAACAGLVALAGASPGVGAVSSPTGAIIDLDFGNISGSTVPDASGSANDGVGKKGAVGSQTSWSPTTTPDSQGTPAVVFDGTQKERIEIPNTAGSLDVNHFSILVRFTLHPSVDTDPAHQRYELMEKAGSFWFNVREDTTPRYLLRVGGFFHGQRCRHLHRDAGHPGQHPDMGGRHLRRRAPADIRRRRGRHQPRPRQERCPDGHPGYRRNHHRRRREPGGRRQAPEGTRSRRERHE